MKPNIWQTSVTLHGTSYCINEFSNGLPTGYLNSKSTAINREILPSRL